ncbi:phosphatidate cytidylyltransferase [Carboxydothermus pertinax]|uniref:Phosphatidate cytidylyltransferase n=1 Tax=Carboxydothermus pertinax TaxID=870242 RepID=A0A1L8CX23_9THEO|nr:phosphatidate cytidylyltransferase [Carboxydothermus pertinax]GAV23468.1 phosphatidate cytidylyltransferase [Carboxydothermus pertinax]
MLANRILTAIVAIPVFLAAGYYGGLYLKVLTGALALFGFFEINRMFAQKDIRLFTPLAYILLVFGFAGLMPIESLPYLFLTVTGIYFVIKYNKHNILEFFYTYTSLLYVFLFIFIYEIRETSAGFWLFLYYFLLIWANDTFAYFIGKKYGRRKIAPNLSPNKSIAGALGGFLGALLVSIIYGKYFLPTMYLTLLPLAFITIFVAQLGDFLESAIKRYAEVKDSGVILPGHGGVLDRFDGVLLSAPVFYYLFLTFYS